MRVNAKKLSWAAAALVAALVVWFGAEHLTADKADAKTPPPVVTVARQPLAVTVEATGTAQPPLVVEVKSRASGTVLTMHAETGQQVGRGALLAEIDPRDVRNALAQAEADAQAARVKVQTTSAARQRAEIMKKDQVITQQEYESAVMDDAAARADMVKASTNLQLAQQKMSDVSIEAPISGTIIEKDVEAGQIIASASQTVSGGTTLFKMADLSTMQIKAQVDETDIGRVQPGQRARVTVEAYPGRTFVGTVEKVEPEAVVDQNVTMFPVLIDLDNREGLIKPGMNADVQIQVERLESAVVVPNDAVVNFKDAASVAEGLGLDAASIRAQMGPGRRQRQGQGQGQNGGSGGGAGSGASSAAWAGAGASGSGWGSRAGSGNGTAPDAGSRRALVFIQTATGVQPRLVVLGMNDLDNSQVIKGVEPGEKVVLAAAVRLQQQQQNQQDQMKQRAGSMLGGGTTGGSGRGAARGG